MSWNYLIESSDDGGASWRMLFRCLTPEGAGEVVRILLQHAAAPDHPIRITAYAVQSPTSRVG